MSTRLLDALRIQTPILQSPLDEFWAIFHTLMWATIYNARLKESPSSLAQANLHQQFRTSTANRDVVTSKIATGIHPCDTKYSLFLRVMSPFLEAWLEALRRMERYWAGVELDGALTLEGFDEQAYQGVLDFVQVWKTHREDLSNYPGNQ
ncbi:hypothetical protein FRC20_004103 [Serendipita sp. 405]|nr:hypothetical protein FRC15_006618 [Serendipita sp. 397]KAG8843012.1 hypothetical protein FRC20_004103 [Serendipita sp. 405]